MFKELRLASSPSSRRYTSHAITGVVFGLYYLIAVSSSVTFRVTEESRPGAIVGNLSLITTNFRSYRLEGQTQYSNYFAYDRRTGIINTTVVIDRDVIAGVCPNGSELGVILFVSSKHGESQISARVIIDDINDNSPKFPSTTVTTTIPEESVIGHTVPIPTARDPDCGPNGTVMRYSILKGNESGHFGLRLSSDRKALSLVLIKKLDREAYEFHVLNISACDIGIPPRCSSFLLNVTVADYNDNKPLFHDVPPRVLVKEQCKSGKTVITLNVTDADSGSNAAYSLSIKDAPHSHSVKTNQLFQIDTATQRLMTIKCLTYQRSVPSYTVVIWAEDQGYPVQHSDVTIQIDVVDINDHSPVLNVRLLLPIVENEKKNAAGLIHVEDDDEGQNANVTLAIISGNHDNKFYLESLAENYFTLKFSGILDREEIAEYNITIQGFDHGDPPLSTTNSIIIPVTDANDNSPVCDIPIPEIHILESTPIGSYVIIVHAVDKDAGKNSEVKYFLDNGNNHSLFKIGKYSGLLTVNDQLDHEAQGSVELKVLVQDNGNIPLSSSCSLTINITDVNDNIPLFTKKAFNISVPEDTPSGSIILNLTASDADKGDNSKLMFDMLFASPLVKRTFHLNCITGVIQTSLPLDREVNDFYHFNVLVQDHGSPSLSSTTVVNIKIMDVNDNSPIIYPKNYYSNIFKNQTSEFIANITATDIDHGQNGTVFYEIVQSDTKDAIFHIDQRTGRVSSFSSFGSQMMYTLKVVAKDGQGVSSNISTLQITIITVQDDPPHFEMNSYMFEIEENVKAGTYVGCVKAMTKLNDGTILYIIYSGDPSGQFSVYNGEIRTSKEVDSEEQRQFNLLVMARTSGPRILIAWTTVTIVVQDVNDNPPTFQYPSQAITIKDTTPMGSVIYQATAFDPDLEFGGTVKYELTYDSDKIFHIDISTGDVLVAGDLLQLTNLTSVIKIMASDCGRPTLTSVLQLTIHVIKVNIFPPLFQSNITFMQLTRNVSIGQPFINVTASDPDGGINSKVYFHLSGKGNEMDLFGLFPDGNLYVQQSLLLIHQSIFLLEIIATDNGDPTLNSSTLVNISVLNSSKQKQLFIRNRFKFEIYENLNPGTLVGKLDLVGGTSYKAVAFVHEHPDFTYDPIMNEIRTQKVLDREKLHYFTGSSSYTLYAEATYNNEFGSATELAKILVKVKDKNDNKPVFTHSKYTLRVLESEKSGNKIFKLATDDQDEGENAKMNFSIIESSAPGTFLVDKEGYLVLNGTLEYKSLSRYNITVQVTNIAPPYFYSKSQVEIMVDDVNDNPPGFTEPLVIVYVNESFPLRQKVVQVVATDKDFGRNSRLAYFITGGNMESVFQINRESGEINLARELDFEGQKSYVLNIRAVDSGIPPLSSTQNVVVNVTDVNDNPPCFVKCVETLSIQEDIATGTAIGECVASDVDSSVNGMITYSISKEKPRGNYFKIDPNNGTFYTIKPLDREQSQNHQILIKAEDKAVPRTSRLSCSKTVTIKVSDVNDNYPRFTSPPAVFFNSSAKKGDYLMLLTARDPDEALNGSVVFKKGTNKDADIFNIQSTGRITLASSPSGKLLYTLNVVASDLGTAPKETSLNLNVFAVGGHGLSFRQKEYSVSIAENELAGTFVLKVIVDAESRQDYIPQINYFMTNDSSKGLLVLNSTTGDISTHAVLDREGEQGAEINLVIYAVDINSQFPRTTSVCVRIMILDTNDNVPTFTEDMYVKDVPEDTRNGSSILTLNAFDGDFGRNGSILFEMVGGNDERFFHVSKETGQIYLAHSLDHELRSSYVLNVTASDDGKPRLSSWITVVINVLDVNDNIPTFERANYSFSVVENSPVGIVVGQTVAYDRDSGGNGQIRYSLSGDDSKLFSVGAKSGILRTASVFDREKVTIYLIKIVATDQGKPQALSTSVFVYISILDENDNNPRFDGNQPFKVTVRENLFAGTPILTLNASDKDFGLNSELIYSISGGDNDKEFGISPNGTLFTAAILDRETTALYHLQVTASDSAPDFTKRRFSTANIRVNVMDVNDETPYFESTDIVHVREDQKLGDPFATVVAFDRDAGTNGEILYELQGVVANAFFQINRYSGKLSLKQTLDREQQSSGHINITIEAKDRGKSPNLKRHDITIVLDDVNDNYPVFYPHRNHVKVFENISIGTELTQITALDIDQERNGMVEYAIVTGNINGTFAIHPIDGTISVVKPLDRELMESYEMNIRAFDLGIPRRENETMFRVQVVDVNDNPPRFQMLHITKYVRENINSVKELATFAATDGDKGRNGEIVYSLLHPSRTPFLDIDTTSGIVSLISPLDRERQATYSIIIGAKDKGIPQQSAQAYLTLIVEDENDHTPVFVNSDLKKSIFEGSPIGSSLCVMNATDPDYRKNGKISYTLVNDFSRFSINSETGEIFTTAELDRELHGSQFKLIVKAQDGGNPPRVTFGSVIGRIADVDDNKAKFKSKKYTAYIRASASVGTFVVAVLAIDKDEGINGKVVYATDDSSGLFYVEKDSGNILTKRTMPPLSATFTLRIQAMNANTSHKDDETIVDIIVTTQTFPVFDIPKRAFNISEDTKPGHHILVAKATDDPVFHIASGDLTESFSLDSVSGNLTLKNRLNYEERSNYSLWLKASLNALYSTYVNIHVFVVDVNDNKPIFQESRYETFFLESTLSNVWVTRVSAEDYDTGLFGLVEYNIVETYARAWFHIDRFTGDIYTVRGIDREQNSSFNFTVQAEDQGVPPQTNSVSVLVNVVDANDNPPVFDQISPVYIFEDASPKLHITTVFAEDKDETSRLSYSLTLAGNYDKTFAILPLTGEVFLVKRLNREVVAAYPVTVIVTDGTFIRNASLNVIVQDVDDNPPKFLKSAFSVKILELRPIGSVVIKLNISDGDIGPNADVVYSLTRTATSEKFRIHSTGIITVASQLRFVKTEKPGLRNLNEYKISVLAENPSHPRNKTQASVTIEVTDANNHSPVFERSVYYGYVPSVSGISTKVLMVKANDVYDVGRNSEVMYGIVGGNGSKIFKVESNTGNITVNSGLTSFVDKLFLVELEAKDRGEPIQTSKTKAKVFITVTEENKYPPVFERGNYAVEIKENYEVGKEFLRVKASDSDSGINGRVSYIIPPDKQGEHFNVDALSGSIMIANEKLDYEYMSKYFFDVVAKDGARDPKSDIATVQVTVLDYNDNPPVFQPPFYKVNILENSPIGFVIVAVRATDRDTIGSKVSYTLAGEDKSYFSIDKSSGEIATKVQFDYESRMIYKLTALAKDSGDPQKTSDCDVLVTVTGVNEFAPEFSKRQYSFSTPEDSPVGTTIGRVSATDGDKGLDGVVQYILVDPSTNKNFDINQSTGGIFISSHLDSETTDQVRLTVLAKNPLQMIVNADNTDRANVIIKIRDSNDPPRFLRKFVRISIDEDIPVGTLVGNFTAVDDDLNSNFSSLFKYSIVRGNFNDSFQVVGVSDFAIIKTSKPLDREQIALFNLTIAATDIKEPSLIGLATLIVELKDVNDNAPLLKPFICPGHVEENLPAGSVVLRFDAFDLDIDPNKDPYTFQITNTESVPFVVDRSSWELKTSTSLDREKVSAYSLYIKVQDSGYPKQTSVHTCQIIVDDVNDNPPSAETLKVKVNIPAAGFAGGVIGNVSPIDADHINRYNCEVEGKYKETFNFLPNSCTLNTKIPWLAFYVLNVRARDERYTVSYSLNISFNKISDITGQRSVILRLSGISPERFLNVMDFFSCKSGYDKQIISIQGVNHVVTDVLLAYSKNGVYMSRQDLSQLLMQCKNDLEKHLGAQISNTDYNACSSNPCIHGDCQPRVIILPGNRTTVYSKTYVFVSAYHRTTANCACSPGYSGDYCEYSNKVCLAKPCKNGGGCVPGGNSFTCICQPNYTGKICDIPFNLCDPNPCSNTSECISTSEGPKCQCDFGGRGNRCELTSIGFQALSYMKLPTLPSSNEKKFNNISMQLATVQRNALIFFNHGNKDKGDCAFIALEIIQSQLRFSFNLGRSTVRIVADNTVSDGQWHTVTVVRDRWVRT